MDINQKDRLKNSIITPIVVTIVSTYFILPIFDTIFTSLKVVSGGLWRAIIDSIFVSASCNSPEIAIFFCCQIGLSIYLGTVLSSIIIEIKALSLKTIKDQSKTGNSQEYYKKKKRSITIAYVTSGVILFVWGIVILVYYFFSATLYSSFNRKIDIISPYVPYKTVLQLKSDWARMEGKSDFESISNQLDEILTVIS